MREIRAVDNDQRIGPRRDDRVGSFADAAQDPRQFLRN